MSYVTAAELRASADAAGLALNSTDYPDGNVNAAIALAAAFTERVTGQWFDVRAATALLDGTDSDLMQFPVPICAVTAVYINGDFTNPLPADNYAVYAGRLLPDDRRNPRVKLTASGVTNTRSIFTQNHGISRFLKGRQNQKVVGTFGFVEADDSTPLAIKRAVSLLALEKLGALVIGGTPGPPPLPFAPAGSIAEERTDGHSIRYAIAPRKARPLGLSGITRNPEVEDIWKLYKSPIKLASPVSWSWSR